MENILKKPKKSQFTHGIIAALPEEQQTYHVGAKKVLENTSPVETIAILQGNLSVDGLPRPLLLSREIVDKIEADHGPICGENLIHNAHGWEFAVLYPYKGIDKINLIKQIPNSDNYLLIAANRDNGFYLVTHFETKSVNDKNLKRLLGRGSVVSRGPSVCL